jgi:aminoglycoside phosphotransferase (APT) family kinase protein
MPSDRLAPEDVQERLTAFLQRHHDARSVHVDDLRLLTGGASRQTWSFDATIEYQDGRLEALPLVARADPRKGPNVMSRDVEYHVLEAAATAGVPVPHVHAMGDNSLGVPFFLMERVEGETIPRRILRDEDYADARAKMTAQLGGILAAVHSIPVGDLPLQEPEPGLTPAETEVKRFEQTFRATTPDPHPAFELAFRWLRENLPAPTATGFVHGDFRMGNLIVGPEGVRSVLDWELAHIGDPLEDFGFLCVRSWRFGNDHLPVAGVGRREELIEAYEAVGGRKVDRRAIHWWEVFGNLRWGVITIMQAAAFLAGMSKSVELAAIGRRTAETEWELLNLMEKA